MGRVREAATGRCGPYRGALALEQAAGAFEPPVEDVPVQGHTHGVAKGAREMRLAEGCGGREIGEAQRSRQIVVDEHHQALQLRRRQRLRIGQPSLVKADVPGDHSRHQGVDEDVAVELTSDEVVLEGVGETATGIEKSGVGTRRPVAQLGRGAEVAAAIEFGRDEGRVHKEKEHVDFPAHLAIEDIARLTQDARPGSKASRRGDPPADRQRRFVLAQRQRHPIARQAFRDGGHPFPADEAAQREAGATVPEPGHVVAVIGRYGFVLDGHIGHRRRSRERLIVVHPRSDRKLPARK